MIIILDGHQIQATPAVGAGDIFALANGAVVLTRTIPGLSARETIKVLTPAPTAQVAPSVAVSQPIQQPATPAPDVETEVLDELHSLEDKVKGWFSHR